MLVINIFLFSLFTATASLFVTICTVLSSLVIIVAIIVLVIALTIWKKKRKRQEHEIGGNKNKETSK